MKKMLSFMFVVLVCIGLTTVSFAAEMRFTDVKKSDWFYDDVKTAVESGLVNGKSVTIYAPDDKLTYAEAIKLAACMNQLYHDGAVTLTNGTPWYQPYVDYCTKHGIIDREYNYTESATRAGYMTIFAKALPDAGLKAINRVPDDSIPDVTSSHAYAVGVYKLYRAGILTGVDGTHRCNPYANIKRSEVAAILTRMMNEEKRLSFDMGVDETIPETTPETIPETKPETTPETKPAPEPFVVKTQPKSVTVKVNEWTAFSVEVVGGSAPYSYQWQSKNGARWIDLSDDFDLKHQRGNRLGAKTSQFMCRVTSEGEGILRCAITDADGKTIYTNEVKHIAQKATETKPIEISGQPKNVCVELGGTAEFEVGVKNGKAPYSYRWQSSSDGGASFTDVLSTDGYNGYNVYCMAFVVRKDHYDLLYRCVITDADGNTVTSEAVGVYASFAITEQPLSVTCNAGETAVFSVDTVGGTAPYTYRWEVRGPRSVGVGAVMSREYVDISTLRLFNGVDGKSATLSVNVTAAFSDMSFRCVIIDATGASITSHSASLSVK